MIQTDFHQYRPTIALHSRPLAHVRRLPLFLSHSLPLPCCFLCVFIRHTSSSRVPSSSYCICSGEYTLLQSASCSPACSWAHPHCTPSPLRRRSCLFNSGRQRVWTQDFVLLWLLDVIVTLNRFQISLFLFLEKSLRASSGPSAPALVSSHRAGSREPERVCFFALEK